MRLINWFQECHVSEKIVSSCSVVPGLSFDQVSLDVRDFVV